MVTRRGGGGVYSVDALLGILLSPSFKFVKDVLFARCWFRVVLKAFLRRVKPWTFEKRHNRHLGRFQILQHIAKFLRQRQN